MAHATRGRLGVIIGMILCILTTASSARAGIMPPTAEEICSCAIKSFLRHRMSFSFRDPGTGKQISGDYSPASALAKCAQPPYRYQQQTDVLYLRYSHRDHRFHSGARLPVALRQALTATFVYTGSEPVQVDYKYADGAAPLSDRRKLICEDGYADQPALTNTPQPEQGRAVDLPLSAAPPWSGGQTCYTGDSSDWARALLENVVAATRKGHPRLGRSCNVLGHPCYHLIFPDGTIMDVCRRSFEIHRIRIARPSGEEWLLYNVR